MPGRPRIPRSLRTGGGSSITGFSTVEGTFGSSPWRAALPGGFAPAIASRCGLRTEAFSSSFSTIRRWAPLARQWLFLYVQASRSRIEWLSFSKNPAPAFGLGTDTLLLDQWSAGGTPRTESKDGTLTIDAKWLGHALSPPARFEVDLGFITICPARNIGGPILRKVFRLWWQDSSINRI